MVSQTQPVWPESIQELEEKINAYNEQAHQMWD